LKCFWNFNSSICFHFESCVLGNEIIFLYKKEKIFQIWLVKKIFGLLVKNDQWGVVKINQSNILYLLFLFVLFLWSSTRPLSSTNISNSSFPWSFSDRVEGGKFDWLRFSLSQQWRQAEEWSVAYQLTNSALSLSWTCNACDHAMLVVWPRGQNWTYI